ncbi:LOW QUALITY PROTEIN: SAP30-binding protein-like [Motacilla alba alba]|uniref:LOW QUALITY PROTEIN: SAP30-binding protein-like n=1 Tax=Motacilla alba alba TaxID=1094192 RepID=UPI0018D556BC|nr:LOW QUALITY PROTEIN: SAP30-binding protein-like [Motacilla alba alba]
MGSRVPQKDSGNLTIPLREAPPRGRNQTFLPGYSLRPGTPRERYHRIPRGQELHNRHWTSREGPFQIFPQDHCLDRTTSITTDDNSQTEKPEAADLKEFQEVEERDPQEPVASFSERVWNMSPDEIKIPPEPLGRCSNQLQNKIKKLYERKMKEGMDVNCIVQNKKEFRNPGIYEKLIQFCSIDEIGTNYPKDMFDPQSWSEDSYYEALAKAQKTEMDKLKKAKKECTKIEFVTGTKKGTTRSAGSTTTTTPSTTGGDAQKRRRSR